MHEKSRLSGIFHIYCAINIIVVYYMYYTPGVFFTKNKQFYGKNNKLYKRGDSRSKKCNLANT